MNTSFIAQVDIQLLEVNATEPPPDGRHDDIFDQRVDNLAESCADNNSHGHVPNIAPRTANALNSPISLGLKPA